jgi:excisionase family DNA binding protein
VIEDPDRLRTADEIADVLAVPLSWVREHTRSGAIPHVRLGRYVRYSLPAVLAWAEGLAQGGGPTFRRYHPSTENEGQRRRNALPRGTEGMSFDAKAE